MNKSQDNFRKTKTEPLPIKTETDFHVNQYLQPHGLRVKNMDEDQQFLQEMVKNEESSFANESQHLSKIMDSVRNVSILKVDDDFQQNNVADEGSENLKIFTLNSAYEQIGGFGILQFISTICLTIIRNFGSVNVLMFGLSTVSMKYVCRTNEQEGWTACSAKKICSMKDQAGF